MYTTFFGLNEKPFSITPDPSFLFLSERHTEALAHLLYGVTESGGFIQLTGEVGTGKTTLTRCLLDRLPANVDLAVVLNPRLNVQEFLATIFDELQLAPPEEITNKTLIDTLNAHLLESHARGRRTVLLVDEAQNLDSEVLEQLRLLTNLETTKEKLLQIILVGQPELRTTLARNDLRQLAQRITGRYHLENLSAEETITYIRHRMKVAGATRHVFDDGALWEIQRLTNGSPRLINVICDRALLGAYAAESEHVSRAMVKAAAVEVQGTVPISAPQPSARNNKIREVSWLKPLAAAVGALALLLAWQNFRPTGTSSPEATAQAATSSTTPAAKDTPRTSLSLSRSLSPRTALEPNRQTVALSTLLANPELDTSTDEAFRSLFTLWQRPASFGSAPPCRYAQEQGLKCEFLVGSRRLIETINRPAILSLVDDGGQLHNAILIGMSRDTVQLRIDDATYVIGNADLARYWYGEFLVLWQPQNGVDSLLVQNTRSEGVAWLRRTLARLQPDGSADASNSSTYFDRNLAEQVTRFQRSQRLEADGKAGVQTLIAINTALGINGTPLLVKNSVVGSL